MTKLEGIAQAADRLSDEIIALRRKIHEHPELAFDEHQTAMRVHEFLKRLGIPSRTGIGSAIDRRPRARSGAKEKTPRYDYNQIIYRLDLDNPALKPAQDQ